MKNLSFLLIVLALTLFVVNANAQTTVTPTPIIKAGFNELCLHVNVGWHITLEVAVPATAYMGNGLIKLYKDGKLVDCGGSATVRQLTKHVVEVSVYSNYFAYTKDFGKKFPIIMELHGWRIEITGWVNPF
ncbi:MAG TPA: hypothetical protein PLH37_01880 [bacterium]|nr:hypothetical protein [bacterium]